MDQLSGADDVSLFAERRNVYYHVAFLSIYDVSTAPGGKVRFKDILKHFQDRLHLNPVFRQRVVEAPLGLDRPYLVAEKDIDVEFHIRHIALPAPGDWRQLMIQVARLHSRPLDRAHPLWEAYVIEGLNNIPKLPPGAFAIFFKIHHALVDGMAFLHLITQIHADIAADSRGQPRALVVDRAPPTLQVLANAAGHALTRAGRLAGLAGTLMNRSWGIGGEVVTELFMERKLPDLAEYTGWRRAPKTRFSGRVSPHRVIEGFGMPLSRIKRVRAKVPEATLNDIFITVASGGVRKYLAQHEGLPNDSLIAMMPIALRSEGSAGGNAVAAVPVSVCSDIADPLERLRAVHAAADASKAKGEAMGLENMKEMLDVLPAPAVNLLLDRFMVPNLNLAISNVRGPDRPMYIAGAKAMCLYPVSIPTDGVGLNLSGVSYNGIMWVMMVSCRKMLPDPENFIAGLHEAWTELLAAADALPEVGNAGSKAKAKKSPPRRRRPGATRQRRAV